MQNLCVTYKEGNEYLLVSYSVESEIDYVAIYDEKDETEYNNVLDGYRQEGKQIISPDDMTDDDLLEFIYDIVILIAVRKATSK